MHVNPSSKKLRARPNRPIDEFGVAIDGCRCPWAQNSRRSQRTTFVGFEGTLTNIFGGDVRKRAIANAQNVKGCMIPTPVFKSAHSPFGRVTETLLETC